MADPWAVVTEESALARAGADAIVVRTPAVTYAVGSTDLVLVIEPGDRPDDTGVSDFETVALHAPFPEVVENWFDAGPAQGFVVWGFARLAHGCVALGPLHVGMRGSTRTHATAPARLTRARLSLRERMPFPLLDQVRPTAGSPAPSLTWLDLVPADPAGALRAFVDTWFADVPQITTGVEAAPVAVPAALRELYRAAAGRPEVLGRQNHIHLPGALRPDPETGLVEFGTEGQGGFSLLMDSVGDDPRVWYSGRADDLIPERERLSAFLLQVVLTEQAYAAPYGGFAHLDRAGARKFVGRLRRVSLRPARWPTDQTFHYVGADGFLAVVAVDGDEVEVHVGARHRSALRGLRGPGFTWSRFTG
ncbi:hypothetical protein [Paractinoplanes maris]|uniref:hypothetical protein n=1 Tax=Paractinoplanes maris TaxID=1734446 RepID=UPI0020221107|nr:hypothetical protein [Actinoplanes maris]